MAALACVACVVTLIGCWWHGVEGAGAGAGRVEVRRNGVSMGARRRWLAGEVGWQGLGAAWRRDVVLVVCQNLGACQYGVGRRVEARDLQGAKQRVRMLRHSLGARRHARGAATRRGGVSCGVTRVGDAAVCTQRDVA